MSEGAGVPIGRVVGTERKPNTPHEFHFWTAGIRIRQLAVTTTGFGFRFAGFGFRAFGAGFGSLRGPNSPCS